MAGNALGRLYIKIAEEALDGSSMLPMGGQPQNSWSGSTGNWVPGMPQHMTTPMGLASQVGGMIDPELGNMATMVSQALYIMGKAPDWATQYLQQGPGPNAQLTREIQQQSGIVSMTSAASLGRELRTALSGEGKGTAAQLIQGLSSVLPKELMGSLQNSLKVDPNNPGKTDLVLGMVAGSVIQNFPKAAQVMGTFFPNIVADARPLMGAYKASHGGNFDQAGFEKFVGEFTNQTNQGAFSRRDSQGNPIPGSMPAQQAAQLAAYAAEHSPQGSTPEQLLKATSNLSQNVHNVMDTIAETAHQSIDVGTAMSIVRANPNPYKALSDPKAATTFAQQYGEVAKASGMNVAELGAHVEQARRQGYNPALALQGIAQHSLAQLRIGQDPTLRELPQQVQARLGAGFGQAATTGVHTSDNLKVLAAAASMSPAFSSKLQKAFKSGDPQALAGLVQQAKGMPNALARYRNVDTSYVENMMAEGGPQATKAFLGAEITDLSHRAMTDQLTRMPTSEILKRMKTHDTSGLSNQAAAMFDRPEFISSLLYTRGQYDTPKTVPQVPQTPKPITPPVAPQVAKPPQVTPPLVAQPVTQPPVAQQPIQPIKPVAPPVEPPKGALPPNQARLIPPQ